MVLRLTEEKKSMTIQNCLRKSVVMAMTCLMELLVWILSKRRNDKIRGGSNHDTIKGGAGDDLLTGDDGDDLFMEMVVMISKQVQAKTSRLVVEERIKLL